MYCLRCGHPLKPGGRFCAGCGQPVAAAPVPPAGSQAVPPPAAAKPVPPLPPLAGRPAVPVPPVRGGPAVSPPPRPAPPPSIPPATTAPVPAPLRSKPAAEQPLPGRSRHSAGFALAAAILVPGAGQAYNGQFGLGILVLLGSVLIFPYFLGIWGAAHVAKKIAAAGGREGRGGFAWVLIQAMLGANLLLFTLVLLTVTGVLP